MESFDPVTRQGLSVTNLFWAELIVSGLLLALVVVWLVTALVRFRARGAEAAEPAQVHGNRSLELIWTATPAVVLAVVFFFMIQTMRTVDAELPGAQPLRIIGHQWWWEFVYPDQQAITANELHVAAGSPLQVTLESIDVIHDFPVPQGPAFTSPFADSHYGDFIPRLCRGNFQDRHTVNRLFRRASVP